MNPTKLLIFGSPKSRFPVELLANLTGVTAIQRKAVE